MDLAQRANAAKEQKPLEEIVPAHYHQFLKVFEQKASERFPPA